MGRVYSTWLRGVKVYDAVQDQHLFPIGEFLDNEVLKNIAKRREKVFAQEFNQF
jgi:hypothetical protein